MQTDLFGHRDISPLQTEGIKYTGSKLKIIPYILNTIADLNCNSVLDAFSGTTRVSQAFAQQGFTTTSNALQRGLWTHTKNAENYFNSLTNGWIPYEHNETLVKLFRLALNSTKLGHIDANKVLQADIDNIRSVW